MAFLEHIIALIAPHYCLGCSKEGDLICKSCAQKLPEPPSVCYFCYAPQPERSGLCKPCSARTHLSAIFVKTIHQDVAKQLVHKAKFDRGVAGLKNIARLLPRMPMGDYVVTPLPTANARVRSRGYDHAHKIAQEYARHKGLAYARLLARTNNERQVGATASERHKHIRGAFRISGVKRKMPQDIILIDDVITTGSSVSEAARALHAAGARHVVAVVFAYTLPKSPHN